MFLFKHIVALLILLCYMPGTVHCMASLCSSASPEFEIGIFACGNEEHSSSCDHQEQDSQPSSNDDNCPCHKLTQTGQGQVLGFTISIPNFVPFEHDIALWQARFLKKTGYISDLTFFEVFISDDPLQRLERRLPPETNSIWNFSRRAALPARMPDVLA